MPEDGTSRIAQRDPAVVFPARHNQPSTETTECIKGITANVERCREMVYNSTGLVTALNPVLGYEVSTQLAKEALEQNKGVYDLVLEKKLLPREELDRILAPENMIHPQQR